MWLSHFVQIRTRGRLVGNFIPLQSWKGDGDHNSSGCALPAQGTVATALPLCFILLCLPPNHIVHSRIWCA